jgi:hypothetical protein
VRRFFAPLLDERGIQVAYSFDELLRVARGMCESGPAFMRHWPPEVLAIWLRYGCRCAYCDRDLLESRGIAYCFSDREHVLPKCKYPSLESDLANLVVACAACNTIKGDWDPNKERPLVTVDVQHLTDDQHDELVARSRNHVQTKMAETEHEFKQARELILGFLRGQRARTAGA